MSEQIIWLLRPRTEQGEISEQEIQEQLKMVPKFLHSTPVEQRAATERAQAARYEQRTQEEAKRLGKKLKLHRLLIPGDRATTLELVTETCREELGDIVMYDCQIDRVTLYETRWDSREGGLSHKPLSLVIVRYVDK